METDMQPNATDRLDSLFKWLLAPTSFLMLIAWNYTNYFMATGLAHPELAKILKFEFQETDLLIASRVLTTEVTVFGVSIFLFLIAAMSEQRTVRMLLRFLSFWGISFTLALIWLSFAQAEFPLILLPTPTGEVALFVSAVIGFLLSIFIVWKAFRPVPRK